MAAVVSVSSGTTDITNVNETIMSMKASLGNLGKLFDSLGQTTQTGQADGETETNMSKLRSDIQESDRNWDKKIKDVKEMIDKALKDEIVDHLRQLVEAGVLEQIDEIVKQEVEVEVARLQPQKLQSEVQKCRDELEQAQRELHNSESRRTNALLRTSRMSDELQTLYTPDGVISSVYPPTLEALVSLDGDTVKQLLKEYKFNDIADSREANVNRFMQFCGVIYQLVTTAGGDGQPGKITICEVSND